MSHAPIIRRLQPLEKFKGHHGDASEGTWSRLVAPIAAPDLPMILAFCLTGLLIAFSVIQRYPDFGAVIEQFNQF